MSSKYKDDNKFVLVHIFIDICFYLKMQEGIYVGGDITVFGYDELYFLVFNINNFITVIFGITEKLKEVEKDIGNYYPHGFNKDNIYTMVLPEKSNPYGILTKSLLTQNHYPN